MAQKKITLELTQTEVAHLRGAIFLGQAHSQDEVGRPNPALTRVEAKIAKAVDGVDS